MSKKRHSEFFNHDGTSQPHRFLEGLDSLYAKIDDREDKDLLAFLWKMAQYVQYYDSNNNVNGNWQDFFTTEKAVALALIATTDTSVMERQFLEVHSETEETNSKDEYLPLFDLLYKFTVALKDLYEQTEKIIDTGIILSSNNKVALESFIENTLELYWGYTGNGQSRFQYNFTTIATDLGLTIAVSEPELFYSLEVDTLDSKMRFDTYELHQDLQKLFKTAIFHSEDLLTKELSRYGDYTPHIGLVLTFLKLYRQFQDQLNGLTEKHLLYYYHDVLGIEYREKVADSLFLLVELAKNSDTYRIDEGTAFKGGKDSAGNPRYYNANNEGVINKSSTTEFKSLYRYTEQDEDGNPIYVTNSNGTIATASGKKIKSSIIRTAIEANSADGKGEPLGEDNPQYPPFGNESIDTAQIGFAVSSPVLRMSGGKRIFTISLTLEQKESGSDLFEILKVYKPTDLFDIYITGEKEWIHINEYYVEPVVIISQNDNNDFALDGDAEALKDSPDEKKWELTFTVEDNFAPIVDFSSELHEGNFSVNEPICKFEYKKYSTVSLYEVLQRLFVIEFSIAVDHSGIKDLILQSDLGNHKPAKPFMPLGAQPKGASNFYIGSKEVLSKKIDNFSVQWDWSEFPTVESATPDADDPVGFKAWYTGYETPTYPTVYISRLIDKEWHYVKSGANKKEFDCVGKDVTTGKYTFSNSVEGQCTGGFIELEEQKGYTVDSSGGFLKITLKENGFHFGHQAYPKALIGSINASYKSVTVDGTTTTTMDQSTVVNAPISPVGENISLSYSSKVTSDTDSEISLFHLYPFGTNKTAVSRENITANFVPSIDNEGYFYIGLSNVVIPQNVSLLFLFVEGTGDLDTPMPEDIQWEYLGEDTWESFDEQGVVSDSNNGFSGNGIITFSLSEKAVTTNTIMPEGKIWLRASISEKSRAINLLSSVTAQALTATLDDNDYADDHYTTALEKGTVSKLKVSRAEVKAVTQPIASFGGRGSEEDRDFQIRVSERLRHKDRAITLWDYEHLVLEQFPEIFKVKCLNHFNAISEIAPGHIRIIVIPRIEDLTEGNILKPAVSITKRKDILQYLEKRCSTMVRLAVENPRYDELQVTADVTFHQSYDEGFYNKQLALDIQDYLTPWKRDSKNVNFIDSLHSSSILNFIEEREYVDYLTKFEVKKINGNSDPVVLGEIEKTFGDSLFVSAEKHFINVIE